LRLLQDFNFREVALAGEVQVTASVGATASVSSGEALVTVVRMPILRRIVPLIFPPFLSFTVGMEASSVSPSIIIDDVQVAAYVGASATVSSGEAVFHFIGRLCIKDWIYSDEPSVTTLHIRSTRNQRSSCNPIVVSVFLDSSR
jgi:hypothetical protein